MSSFLVLISRLWLGLGYFFTRFWRIFRNCLQSSSLGSKSVHNTFYFILWSDLIRFRFWRLFLQNLFKVWYLINQFLWHTEYLFAHFKVLVLVFKTEDLHKMGKIIDCFNIRRIKGLGWLCLRFSRFSKGLPRHSLSKTFTTWILILLESSKPFHRILSQVFNLLKL